MTSSADQIKSTFHGVNDISVNNKQQIAVLAQEISKEAPFVS
jgi:hypothetical protein